MIYFEKERKELWQSSSNSSVIIDVSMNVHVETLFTSGYHGLYTTIPWSSNNRNR